MIPALLFPLRVSSMVRSDGSDNDSSFQKEPVLPPFFPVTINDLSPLAHGCQMRRGEGRKGKEEVSEFCIQLNDNTGNCNELIFSAHRGPRTNPTAGSFIAALTLEGIRVSGQKVLQLVAVGVDIVDGFSFDGKLVALLHLSGAAGGSLVLTNQQIHIWKERTRGHLYSTATFKRQSNVKKK